MKWRDKVERVMEFEMPNWARVALIAVLARVPVKRIKKTIGTDRWDQLVKYGYVVKKGAGWGVNESIVPSDEVETGGNTPEVVKEIYRIYEEVKGMKMPEAWGKDGKIIKRLIKLLEDEGVEDVGEYILKLWRFYLATPRRKWYYLDSVESFYKYFNKVRLDYMKSREPEGEYREGRIV